MGQNISYANSVVLRGTVGAVRRTATPSEKRITRFTLVTEGVFRDSDNTPKVETEWHNITAWSGGFVHDDVLEKIEKGSKVELTGRLKHSSYVGADGVKRSSWDIIASSVTILDSRVRMCAQS